MENKFTKFTKYFLLSHVALAAFTIIWLLFVRISLSFQTTTYHVTPLYATYKCSVLNILLFIQFFLYLSRAFLILPCIAMLFYRRKLSVGFFTYLGLICLICISVKLNWAHIFFNYILPYYDFDAYSLRYNGEFGWLLSF